MNRIILNLLHKTENEILLCVNRWKQNEDRLRRPHIDFDCVQFLNEQNNAKRNKKNQEKIFI